MSRPAAASARGEFPFITVSGSSFEMGQQHGSQAREIIRHYIDYIVAGGTKPREVMLAEAMEFVSPIEALSPSYILETRGLADGAGITFAEAMLCQTRGALPHPSDTDRSMEEAASDTYRRANSPGSSNAADHCTAFALCGAATRARTPMTGQNQDVSLAMEEFGLVVRLRPSDGRPAALMFTWAGQLGYHGLNEHGVTHFANGLTGGPRGVPAIPHYPLKRACLEQRSVAQCEALLNAQPVCSSGNMVFADGAGEVADVEISPNTCISLSAEHAFKGSFLHTNHFLDPVLSQRHPPLIADSLPRLVRLRSLVELGWGDLTVGTMKTILADHGDGIEAGGAGECEEGGCICRHGLGAMDSVCGYIADVGTRTLHVRRGHGCTGKWTAYVL